MAKSVVFLPFDPSPRTGEPGVRTVEGAYSGGGSRDCVPPEAPLRRAKGDIGWMHFQGWEVRNSVPFTNLRKDKDPWGGY